MKVLVTGSAGQLGRTIFTQLWNDGHEVRGMDERPSPTTTCRIDICERPPLPQALEGMDAVIHIASLHAPHVGVQSRDEFLRINVTGTLGLLEAAVKAGVRKFVYASSTSVYGFSLVPVDRAVWVTESLTAKPRDIYDVSKLAAEQLCLDVARESGMAVICLRACRFFAEPPAVVASHRLYRGADVRDIARAHVLAALHNGPCDQILNIAGPYPFSEHDTPELLANAPSVVRRYLPNLERAFQQHGWTLPTAIDRVYSSQAAERQLGYRPQFDLNALLREPVLAVGT